MRDHKACQPAGQGSLAPLVTGWLLCWLFSSGHLADYPIAVVSGFIAGTAPVCVADHPTTGCAMRWICTAQSSGSMDD